MFRRDVDYCSGAFLLTPRAVWERLGGFDEAYAPAYYEETDYCMRLWENGLRIVYEPAAVILHYEFGSAAPAKAIELQAAHQKTFAQRHSSALQNHHASDASILVARTHRKAGTAARHVLVLDDRVPHPWLGSGYPRARTMLVANLHATSYPPDERLPDAELLRAATYVDGVAAPDEPVVLAGDFNVTFERSRTLLDLTRPEWGFSQPGTGIDHVLVRNRELEGLHRWPLERRRRGELLLSDHAPVDATIA